MQRFLDKALGWTVCLVIVAIIGTVTSLAQTAFGDTGAYIAFFGLIALMGLMLVVYNETRSLRVALVSIPKALWITILAAGAFVAIAIAIIAVLAGGYSIIQFLEQYGIMGAIFIVLVIIAIQLGMIIDKKRS